MPATEEGDEGDETLHVEPAAHHRLILERLEQVESGEPIGPDGKPNPKGRPIRRLMILAPPGSAKSTYVSVVFPAWFLGCKEHRALISTSYGSNLPKKFGRRCRNLVRSDEYRDVMGVGLSDESTAADQWSLTNGSEYYAAGILAGLVGNRADGAVADDLIKGHEAAGSVATKEKTWEAWISDLRTRIKPRGFLVLITTRWTADDPSGRILPEHYDGETGWIQAKDGEWWYVVCIQAQCERADDPLGRKIGDYLWTDWFPVEHWEQEKRTQGGRNWSALFQQRPSPDEGALLKREHWRFWYPREMTAPPPPVHAKVLKHFPDGRIETEFVPCLQAPLPIIFDARIQSWDMAFKATAESSNVSGQVWYRRWADAYLIDRRRGKMDLPDTLRAVIELSAVHPDTPMKLVEDKANGPAVIQTLKHRIPGLVPVEPVGDKVARAQAVSPYIESGNVWLPHPALYPWVNEVIDEAAAFPHGPRNDDVDAMTQALVRLLGAGAVRPAMEALAASIDGDALGTITGGIMDQQW